MMRKDNAINGIMASILVLYKAALVLRLYLQKNIYEEYIEELKLKPKQLK